MPPSLAVLTNRWAAGSGGLRALWRIVPVAAVHVAALAVMVKTEFLEFPYVAGFLLCWALLNFVWLAVLRRPGVAAVLSLALVVVLVQLSILKYKVLWQTVNFVDLMIVDPAALAYLLGIFPNLPLYLLVAVTIAVPLLALLWRIELFRVPRLAAAGGVAACIGGLGGLSVTHPFDPHDNWFDGSHVSSFARSGFDVLSEYMRRGFMESDPTSSDRLTAGAAACQPSDRHPHIIMVHDESAFDLRQLPNVTVPPGYGRHFRSFDGKQRDFIVEAVGGPSWFTEYNVFSGLSARSFGRFAYFVTKIAAGRVERGLPNALRRCGYRTYSLYPAHGAFLGAKSFQTTAGVQNFFDMSAMRARTSEPDAFYYDRAAELLRREREGGPMFLFIYLSANHFPWDYRWRPELTPDWKGYGNVPLVEEYLRRQILGMQDYRRFLERLRREFPDDRFLIVRYGDHQPDFATLMHEPGLDADQIAQRIMAYDVRYFLTYYAIDAVNFRPVNVSSANDVIEAAYLPLITLESAGVPLDESFVEQKRIFLRCNGLFYRCADGAEVRRFNRLLIDAGLIKGL